MVHYDPSSRVPLIIGGPGLQQNKVYTNITSQIDLYPTMMEMTGLTAPEEAGLEGEVSATRTCCGAPTNTFPFFLF